MEKKMDNEMETGVIMVCIYIYVYKQHCTVLYIRGPKRDEQ